MDPLSVTASILGILGFVGQSINGINTLASLVKQAGNADSTVDNFLREIDGFHQCLLRVEELLHEFESGSSSSVHGEVVVTLVDQAQACSRDVALWSTLAKDLLPRGQPKSLKAFFAKLKVLRNRDGIVEFRRQLAYHQSALTLSCSTLNS